MESRRSESAPASVATEIMQPAVIRVRPSLLADLNPLVTTAPLARIAKPTRAMITAEDCVSFVDAWQDDLEEWQTFSSGVNNVGSTRDALDFLQLSTWTRAEFGGVTSQSGGLATSCRTDF